MDNPRQALLDLLHCPDWLGFALMQECAKLYIASLNDEQITLLWNRVQLTHENHTHAKNNGGISRLGASHD